MFNFVSVNLNHSSTSTCGSISDPVAGLVHLWFCQIVTVFPLLLPPSSIMGEYTGLSHCKLALAFAVFMDVVGGAALLVGVFANLKIQDRDLGDVLVYSGALFLLVSLAGWVLWYSGNIEGPSLADDKKQGHISYAVDRIARTLSRKIRSHRYRS